MQTESCQLYKITVHFTLTVPLTNGTTNRYSPHKDRDAIAREETVSLLSLEQHVLEDGLDDTAKEEPISPLYNFGQATGAFVDIVVMFLFGYVLSLRGSKVPQTYG
jgi:hypothetical protein